MTKSDRSAMRPALRPSPIGRSVLLVAVGVILGSLLSPGGGDRFPLPTGLFAQEGVESGGMSVEGDYQYFTFRRNLWAIHRPSGRVQFMLFPDGREDALVRSAVHQVDPTEFPPEQVRFQLSERNLTNYLWVLNPVTGKARYLRAGRDAVLEASEIHSAGALAQ